MSDNPETGYLEDCCWDDPQDQCPKRYQQPQPCQCRCHREDKPRPANGQELLQEVARLRRQRDHALDMAQEDRDALAEQQARIARLEEVGNRMVGGFDVLCEYGILPERYREEARALADAARAILAETAEAG